MEAVVRSCLLANDENRGWRSYVRPLGKYERNRSDSYPSHSRCCIALSSRKVSSSTVLYAAVPYSSCRKNNNQLIATELRHGGVRSCSWHRCQTLSYTVIVLYIDNDCSRNRVIRSMHLYTCPSIESTWYSI